MKLFEFTAQIDFKDVKVVVPVARIVSVRLPSSRIHEHGGLTLDTGTSYSFSDDSTAERALAEMRAVEEPAR